MKIKKLKFENHPVLADLELNFTDKTEKSVDTIILAGENGTGKTVILETIYEFLRSRATNTSRLSIVFETSENIRQVFEKQTNFALIYHPASQYGNSTNINFEELHFAKGSFFFIDEYNQTVVINPEFKE